MTSIAFPPTVVSRRTLLAGGLGALGLGLTGCGRSGDSRLRATWWGDPGLNEAVLTAVRAYEAAHGGPAVHSEFLPWDGYWDKLATQTAGKSEPDLIMQAGTYLPEYVPRHVLLDLNPHLGQQIRVDDIDRGVRDIGTYDGGTYALIAAINSPTVIVNRSLLERAGLEMPEHDWTWPDLQRLCAGVARELGDDGYGIQDAGGDLISFQVWARQRGVELFDGGELAITPDHLSEWLTFWDELRADGSAPPAVVTAESGGDISQSPIVAGSAAFMIGWNQDLGAIASLAEDDFHLVLLPGISGGQPGQWLNAANMWAASAHTEHVDDVAALIDFLINDEAAIDALGTRLGVPPLARARDRVRETVDETDLRSLDYIEVVEKHSRPLPELWPRGFTELRNLLPRLNENIGFGERSIADAVDQFFAETERVLT